MDSRAIRIFITKHKRMYVRLAPLWRKVNRGVVARIQYAFIFSKYYKRIRKEGGIPLWDTIEIETFNRCNGECSFCPVNRHIDPRKPVRMKESLFQKIIDELGALEYCGSLSLFSNNEPYLDNRIIDFMKYAREEVPKAHLMIYTNGTLLSMEKYRESLKYLDEIYIDNYSDDGTLHENIKLIKNYMEANEDAKKKTVIAMRKQNEVLTSRGGNAPNKKAKGQTLPCFLPFRQIVIRPDGKMSLCCNDVFGEHTMGDLNCQSLIEAWHSVQYKNVRKVLSSGRKSIKMCSTCDVVLTVK